MRRITALGEHNTDQQIGCFFCIGSFFEIVECLPYVLEETGLHCKAGEIYRDAPCACPRALLERYVIRGVEEFLQVGVRSRHRARIFTAVSLLLVENLMGSRCGTNVLSLVDIYIADTDL